MIIIDSWIAHKVNQAIEEGIKNKEESIDELKRKIYELQFTLNKTEAKAKKMADSVECNSNQFYEDLEEAKENLNKIIKSEMLRIDSYSEALEVATNKKYGVCRRKEDS